MPSKLKAAKGSNPAALRFDRRPATWLWSALLIATAWMHGTPATAQPTPKIDRVTIEGNVLISEKRIRSLIVTKPTGRIFNRKRFDPVTFTADKEALENFYLNSGFLDVVVRPFQTLSPDGKRVSITIRIREGPRYVVKEVNITGNRYLTDDEIQSILLTRAGQPFFRLFMATDKRALQILAEQHALLDAVIQDEAIVNSDTTVTVHFSLQEGAPIKVGKIRLRGLQKTKPHVVLRELTIAPSHLYDNVELIRSRTRLFQTGLFRNVRMEPLAADSAAATRDLLISVTELPGGEVEFGAGFASVEGFRGSIGITQHNWRGRGIGIGSRIQISTLIQQGEARYTQPWLFRTNTTGTVRVFFDRQDFQSHVRRRTGLSFTASRELSLAFHAQTTYTIENVRVTSVDPSLARIIATGDVVDSLKSRREGSLTQNVLYDTRDDVLNTTRGTFFQVQGNISSRFLGSASGENNSILATSGAIRKYFPVRGFPDFATSWNLAYVRALSDNLLPLDKRLFLGGDKSVRGFDVDEIGQPAGGVISLNVQNEMRVQLPKVIVAQFIDFGGVGATVHSFSFNDIRFGFGGGVRVMTPIGLIRLDVGFHRRSKRHQDAEKLSDRTFYYFGLGQAF